MRCIWYVIGEYFRGEDFICDGVGVRLEKREVVGIISGIDLNEEEWGKRIFDGNF